MANLNQLYDALRNAHAAGDTAAAQRLAGYIQQMSAAPPVAPPEELAPTEDTGFFDMAGRALARGAKQTGSLLADVLPAMAAKAVGADEYAARQMEEAKQTQEEIAQKYGARYKELADVKGLGDVLPFIAETVIEQVPNIATALIPGVGGGAIAARTAAGLAAKEAAKRVATGQLAGVGLGSYALNAPEIFQNIYEETGQMESAAAALAGSVAAALDSILPAAVLKTFSPGMKAGVVEKILERSGMNPGIARSATAGIFGGAATEGPTEAAQEAISIAAEKFVQENAPAWGSKEFNRLIESGVRGAVGGAGISGTAGAISGIGARRRAREAAEEFEIDVPGKERTAFDEFEESLPKAEPRAEITDEDIPLPEMPEMPARLKPTAERGVEQFKPFEDRFLYPDLYEEEGPSEVTRTVPGTREPGVPAPVGAEALLPTAGRAERAEQRRVGVPSEPTDVTGAGTEDVLRALKPEQLGLELTPATEETRREIPKSLIEEAEPEFELTAPEGVAPKEVRIEAPEAPPGASLNIVGKTPDRLFGFLRNIKPVAEAEAGVKNHQSSVNNFIDEINEYVDPKITSPDQRKENLQAVSDFFDQYSLASDPATASRTAADIEGKAPQEQSKVLAERTKLPNLTRLEGINQLRSEFKDFMSRRSAEELGYTEEQAALKGFDKEFDRISEVGRRLKATSEKTRTPEEQAAVNYFGRWNFRMAMRSAAFDLAAGTPSGEMFSGQGAKQAEQFRKYIEENMPEQTFRAFDELTNLYKTRYAAATKAAQLFARRQKHIKTLQQIGDMTPEQAMAALRKSVFGSALANFKPLHPGIVEKIEQRDLNGALKMVNQVTGNKYYGALAKRLLDANLTTAITFDQQRLLVENELIKIDGARNKLRDYMQVAAPQIDKRLFEGKDPKATLESLDRIVNDKLLPPHIINSNNFQLVYKRYKDLVPSLNSLGSYFIGEDIINLNRQQGGDSYYGLFHESMHAATARLLRNRDALNEFQKAAVKNLEDLYAEAQKNIKVQAYGLTNLDEFIAEAFSNPEFQSQLRAIKYRNTDTTLWSKFMRFILDLMGGERDTVLFGTLANADILMSASQDNINYGGVLTGSLNASGAPTKSATDGSWKTAPDVKTSEKWLGGTLDKSSWNGVKGNMDGVLENVKDTTRKYYLGAFTLRQLKDLIGDRIPQIGRFIDSVEAMLDGRNKILQQVSDITKLWERYQAENPAQTKKLNMLMIDATLNGVDPADPKALKRDARLDETWNSLDPTAQKIYIQVRDFYAERLKAYRATILKNVELAMIADNKPTNEIKARLAELEQKFDKDTIKPYFPLKRFGRYWYQIGEGKDKQFYMFESAGARNAFRNMAERQLAGKDVYTDEGNDVSTLVKQNLTDLQTLKTIKDIVKDATGKDTAQLKESIEDSLDQMYLLTLPDKSARKMFINRKQIQGASADMLRSFTVSAFHMAYQHSRFEHARDMYNQINAARGYMEGKPAREKKIDRDYIMELEKRLQYVMNPTDTGLIPSILSNVSFVWYLTAPASALVNMMGVPAIGLPVVSARYGWNNSRKALGQYAKRFLGTGFVGEDGKFDFPSLQRAKLSDVERRAYDKFVADGLIDVTLSHDLVGMAEAPTNLYTGRTHKVMRVLSSAFHNAEKFNREVMAMGTFNLAYERAKKDGLTGDAAFNRAVDESKDLTYRSMFDYSTLNKPRYFQNSYAKVILQFKQFSQQMTYLLARSVFEMTKGETKEIRTEARNRLMGTLGMTFLFAGATGMPMFSVMSSVIEMVYDMFSDDDEPPLDFENWFKNWMAETFNDFAGDSISRGLITQTTGLNFADRMSLNDLWFRDARKSTDEVTALQNMFINLLGPTAGLAVNAAEALKLYNDGYYYRGAEKILPAFLKQPLVAARYASEGALTLKGDTLIEDISAKDALGQALGFAPEKVAQKQKANIEMKTAEQKIMDKRQNLMNAYFMAVDADDGDFQDRVIDKIDKFNEMYPDMAITSKSLRKSIKGRYQKRALAEETGGIPINKKLIGALGAMGAYGEED